MIPAVLGLIANGGWRYLVAIGIVLGLLGGWLYAEHLGAARQHAAQTQQELSDVERGSAARDAVDGLSDGAITERLRRRERD